VKKEAKSLGKKIEEEFDEMEEIDSKRHKSSSRVSISSSMMGVLLFILTLIWALGPEKISFLIIAQLIMAIPFLFISSLSYAKLIYKTKTKLFDRLGWYSTTIGNNLVLNVIGLMVASYYIPLAYFYFLTIALGMLIYYAINVYYKPSTLKTELIRYIIVILIILIGGVYPIVIRAF
jgi:hypothetical protein